MSKTASHGQSSPWRVHGLGAYVLAALLIGGGTDKWVTSDLILHILALPLIAAALWSFPNRQLGKAVNGLVVAVVAVMIIQLIPTMGLGQRPFLIAIDGGRALDSLIFVMVALSVFYLAAGLSSSARRLILRYVFIGVAANFVLAFAQFAAAMPEMGKDVLPYPLHAGFFENKNHLSALFYMSAPFILATASRARMTWLGLVLLGLIVAFEFVVRSRAGVMLILVGVGIMFATAATRWWLKALSGALAVAAAAGAAWFYAPELTRNLAGSGDRLAFAAQTWKAILDHLPWGTGFGSFQLIYPPYEPKENIVESYLNHAHNDWLELLLEGGTLAGALLLAYGLVLVRRIWLGHLGADQKAALVAIALVLLHSLVDYPLRTLGIAVLFALSNAVLLVERRPGAGDETTGPVGSLGRGPQRAKGP